MLEELQNSPFLHIFISSWQPELQLFGGEKKKEGKKRKNPKDKTLKKKGRDGKGGMAAPQLEGPDSKGDFAGFNRYLLRFAGL